jgi:hypothetical protein
MESPTQEENMLTETTPGFVEAVENATGFQTTLLHTGGGVQVCAIDLSLDARYMGRQAWLTRDGGWLLGFYDFGADPEDEGVCVQLITRNPDDPDEVASIAARLLERVCARVAMQHQ